MIIKSKKVFTPNGTSDLLVLCAIKSMKKNNYGRILNISSGGSVNCSENYFGYSASKAALNVLTKTFSKELKNYNIKVNSISPDHVRQKCFP